jgi:hypothetical protein
MVIGDLVRRQHQHQAVNAIHGLDAPGRIAAGKPTLNLFGFESLANDFGGGPVLGRRTHQNPSVPLADLWRDIRSAGKDQNHQAAGFNRADDRGTPIVSRKNVAWSHPAIELAGLQASAESLGRFQIQVGVADEYHRRLRYGYLSGGHYTPPRQQGSTHSWRIPGARSPQASAIFSTIA